MTSKQLIYLHEPGDGTHSLHQVSINGSRHDHQSIKIVPWNKDTQWLPGAFDGSMSLEIKDTGDGIRLTVGANQHIMLDYSQAESLMMLLDAYKHEGRFFSMFRRFQEVD